MKKIIMPLGIALTFCSTVSFADDKPQPDKQGTFHTVNEKNTKPWGCLDSKEYHEPGTNVYQLQCWDPGEKICQFADGTCPSDFPPFPGGNVRQTVVEQVISGNFTGSIDFPTGTVTWNGVSPDDFSYSIRQNP
ncbi:hypothetical protein MUY27_00105 [Mucilaginibacter sp. RS28]|uniref:Uncharacterized protein n=1 Tax=Mucilaginibacter straminoryzae TaxID=2932774 RepID=A0A9X1WZY5_9SPHI|nr:hypothetical protein [Mucilaginibacter straminoryzae]MCJ8208086.1 hypothetical protein [Mucilaginibacter straminoryzae]